MTFILQQTECTQNTVMILMKRVLTWLSVNTLAADFGDTAISQGGIEREFEATAIQFSAVGYVPLTPRAGIYGRVGAERIRTEASSNNVRVRVEETNPFVGVGGYYNVTENIDVRIEYQRHEQLDEYFDSYNAGLTVDTL